MDYWFLNLTDAVLWAESHEKEVRDMLAAQHEYAISVLMPQRVLQYVTVLMRKYAELRLNKTFTLRNGAVKGGPLSVERGSPMLERN